jgi:hypothetical protein
MPLIKDKIDKTEMTKAIGAIPVGAERQVYNLDTFVPMVDFAVLSTLNTQIIFGRNGTGKSHLFSAFSQHYEQEYNREKMLPIYIDFKALDLGPYLPRIALDDLIIRFYRRFIHKIADRIKQFSDTILVPQTLEKLFGGEISDRKKKN